MLVLQVKKNIHENIKGPITGSIYSLVIFLFYQKAW